MPAKERRCQHGECECYRAGWMHGHLAAANLFVFVLFGVGVLASITGVHFPSAFDVLLGAWLVISLALTALTRLRRR